MANTIKVIVTAGKRIVIQQSQDAGVTWLTQAVLGKYGISHFNVARVPNNPQKTAAEGFLDMTSGEIDIVMNNGQTHKLKLTNIVSPASWSNSGGNNTDIEDALTELYTVFD